MDEAPDAGRGDGEDGGQGGTKRRGWAPPDEPSSGPSAPWSGPAGPTAQPAGSLGETAPLPSAAPVPAGPVPPGPAPWPSPIGGRSRPPLVVGIVGVVALVVLVGVLVAWAVAQMGGRDEELVALGEPILNGSEELTGAEEALRTSFDAATRASEWFEDAVEYDSISCWFSYPDGDQDPNDHVRCGPIVFADSEEATHWLELPVRFSETDEGTHATIGRLTSRRTWAGEGEELRRPDGREAPGAEEIDLERPPAPAVDEDGPVTVAIGPGNVMVDMAEPEDGRLNGLGHTSEVAGHGTADRVLMDDERLARPGVFAAPDGQRWLLFRLETDAGPLPLTGDVTYSIEFDGSAQRLEPDPAARVPGATLATLVPEDAEEVALVVTDDVLEQRWSFTSGSRSGDAPEILYRDPATRVADGSEQSVPYTVSTDYSLPPDYEPPAYPEPPEMPEEFEPEPLPEIPEIPEIPEEYEPEPLPEIPEYEPEPIPEMPTMPPMPESQALGLSPALTPVVRPAGRAAPGQQEEQLTIRFDEARLHYGVQVRRTPGAEELHTAGGSDRALLYLAGLEAQWDSIVAEHALGTESITLILEDGTEVEPLPVTMNLYDYVALQDVDDPLEGLPHVQGFGQLPVWDVPAETERATLRITPQPDGSSLADVEYQGTMEFTLEFG